MVVNTQGILSFLCRTISFRLPSSQRLVSVTTRSLLFSLLPFSCSDLGRNQIPWHAFHWSPCLLQASIDARCLDTAIIKSHSQCLLWDSSPFPKGEQLEAGGGEEQGRDVSHSVSSANTTMFFYHWLFNIWRCHPHKREEASKVMCWLGKYFSFHPHLYFHM